MRERLHRRTLVALLYAFPIMAAAVAGPLGLKAAALAMIITCFLPYVAFSTLISLQRMSPFRPRERVNPGLGLAPTAPREEPEADERDLAIRNRAYYFAYWIFYFCLLVVGQLFNIAHGLFELRLSKEMGGMLMMMLSTLFLSLPQAVVLWSEPDIFEEAV